MFFRKKKTVTPYDPSVREPVIRSSICTGEQSAGFRNLKTGVFEEVMLIRNADDLKEFKEQYAITGEIKVVY